MLTELDLRRLAPLTEGPQTLTHEGRSLLQGLVQRGYVRVSPALSGPLGVPTGEDMATLTEAGQAILTVLELGQTYRGMAAQLNNVADDRKGTERARCLGAATAWREAARRLRVALGSEDA